MNLHRLITVVAIRSAWPEIGARNESQVIPVIRPGGLDRCLTRAYGADLAGAANRGRRRVSAAPYDEPTLWVWQRYRTVAVLVSLKGGEPNHCIRFNIRTPWRDETAAITIATAALAGVVAAHPALHINLL
jgi:hypothetical protein